MCGRFLVLGTDQQRLVARLKFVMREKGGLLSQQTPDKLKL
jgi:hypothetical protein